MLSFLLLLPLPLPHHHGSEHCYHHSDSDDEHGDCFGDTQLRVHVHQPVVSEHLWLLAGQVIVVIQEEPLDGPQLAEHPLQVTVTVPGVPLQQDVGAVSVDVEEGLEVNAGKLVAHQIEQRHAGERLEDARICLADLVPS